MMEDSTSTSTTDHWWMPSARHPSAKPLNHYAMFIEEYCKSKGGRTFFTAYYRFGKVTIAVQDITATDKEAAKAKAEDYLKKALEGEG